MARCDLVEHRWDWLVGYDGLVRVRHPERMTFLDALEYVQGEYGPVPIESVPALVDRYCGVSLSGTQSTRTRGTGPAGGGRDLAHAAKAGREAPQE